MNGDADISAVALSDRTLAWIAVRSSKHGYERAELRWSVAPLGDGPIQSFRSAALPAKGGLLAVQTEAHYAATLGVAADNNDMLYVVELTSGRVHAIRPRTGTRFRKLLAVSDREVVLGEIDAQGSPELTQQLQRIVRYELAGLGALAERE